LSLFSRIFSLEPFHRLRPEGIDPMPIRHPVWTIETKPASLTEASLGREVLMEQLILEDPAIRSERSLLKGRQVCTTHGRTAGNLTSRKPSPA
jgi:hypothetical protein